MRVIWALSILICTSLPALWGQEQKRPIHPVTPQQKEHSRQYKNLGHQKLLERPGTNDISVIVIGEITLSPNVRLVHPAEFLSGIACRSDAIVVGTLINETSLLTEEETFVFTDYEVRIEEIIKDNPSARLVLGDSVIVTRPGGILQIEQRKITAKADWFQPFKVGSRYLLYLKFLPSTGTYRATAKGSYELRGNRYIRQFKWPLWSLKLQRIEDTPSFLDLARSTSTDPCTWQTDQSDRK